MSRAVGIVRAQGRYLPQRQTATVQTLPQGRSAAATATASFDSSSTTHSTMLVLSAWLDWLLLLWEVWISSQRSDSLFFFFCRNLAKLLNLEDVFFFSFDMKGRTKIQKLEIHCVVRVHCKDPERLKRKCLWSMHPILFCCTLFCLVYAGYLLALWI